MLVQDSSFDTLSTSCVGGLRLCRGRSRRSAVAVIAFYFASHLFHVFFFGFDAFIILSHFGFLGHFASASAFFSLRHGFDDTCGRIVIRQQIFDFVLESKVTQLNKLFFEFLGFHSTNRFRILYERVYVVRRLVLSIGRRKERFNNICVH